MIFLPALDKALAIAIVYVAMILLFILVLPGTIALRNILLFTGCFLSAIILASNFRILSREKSKLLVFVFPILIFFWVVFHFCFISMNSIDEWREIRSLWLRSFLALMFGFGLAVATSKHRSLMSITYLSFFFVPLINIVAYLYFSIRLGELAMPNDFLRHLFTKIEATYFGALACAVSFSLFFELPVLDGKKHKFRFILVVGSLILILSSNMISDARNGALIWVLTCCAMVFYSIWRLLCKGLKGAKSNMLLVILIIALFVTWVSVNKSVSLRTWDSGFIADVRAGLDIHSNSQWARGEGAVPLPINSEGSPVNSSTYHRVAWALAGMHLIAEYPFGYGVIKNSFTGLLDASGISHGGLGQTHSGWVDFGLAFGLPGILLLLTWILAIIYIARKNMDGLNILASSIAIIYIPLMLVAETAWKEYLETEFFMLAFASGLVFTRNFRN